MMYTEVKDCMKKICESLRDHAMRIIRFKNKKIMLLIKEQQESHENRKICYICEETFDNKYLKDKKYCKVRDHCHYTREYRGAAHSICNLKYSEPKRTPIVFHNGSDYDYHFIKKESAKEFNKQFTCLGENTEKYLTFTVTIKKKVTRVIKMEKKLKCYILQFIDSDLWPACHQILSIIFLIEFIKLNVNPDTMIKNVKHMESNISIVSVFFNRQILKITL